MLFSTQTPYWSVTAWSSSARSGKLSWNFAANFATAYPPGTPLYGSRVDSAYTVIFKNPNRPYDFTAYGFDPKNNTTIFYVHGDAADLSRLQGQHHLDVERINVTRLSAAGDSILDTIQGQIIKGPPNPPPTGQDAAGLAFKAYQINQ